ncbi:MAG: CARDB domain-containing protein [bacterium]
MRKHIHIFNILVYATMVGLFTAFHAGYDSRFGKLCYAQEPDQVKQELFLEIQELFDQAKAEEIPIFSPTNFVKAQEIYQDAHAQYERGGNLEYIKMQLYQAKTHLGMAFESARMVKTALEDLIRLREQAQGFEQEPNVIANKEAFQKAEDAFHRAVLQAEKGNIGSAKSIGEEAKAGYQEASRFFQEKFFREARMKLEETRDLVSPEEYEKLVQRLEKAESFFEQAQVEGIFNKELLGLLEDINWQMVGGMAFPDLTVELYDVPYSQIKGIHPFPPLTDRPTSLSVLIKNIGLKAVDTRFDIDLYVDGTLAKTWTFLPISPEEDPLHAKNPLMPGGTRIGYDYEVTFPSGGYHTLRWVVDAKNGIAESNENNNALDTTVVWQAPPDLIVEDVGPVGVPQGGQKSTWNIKVTNIGTGAAKIPFLTTFWPEGLSAGAQENFWTQSLPAGQSVNFQTTQSFQAWGKLKLRVTTDVANYVPETLPNGEKNNELVKSFDLFPADLKVENLIVTPPKPTTCDPITLSFSVTNIGTGNAAYPFKVKVMPGKVSAGLIQPTLLTVNKLQAGQSIPMQHTVKLPPGTHQISIEADFPDPNAIYFEPDRNNNVKVAQIYVDGPFKGLTNVLTPSHKLSMCLGESIFIDPTNPTDKARDKDGDWLKDDLEGKLANGFRPYYKFDSDEKALRSIEPITLFQVRPRGYVGPGNKSKTILYIRWGFLYMWDGGYGPDSWCKDVHKGDNVTITYTFASSDNGFSWELTSIQIGGFDSFRWPGGSFRPSYLGKRVVVPYKTINVELYDKHYPVIYMSAHKHHMYFNTAYDHKDSFYSKWKCNEDINGKGKAFLSDLHSVFKDARYNNVGEPEKHPKEHFVNCMLQFPATTITGTVKRTVDTGNLECYNIDNKKGYYYSAWGSSHFYECEGNVGLWLGLPQYKFWTK